MLYFAKLGCNDAEDLAQGNEALAFCPFIAIERHELNESDGDWEVLGQFYEVNNFIIVQPSLQDAINLKMFVRCFILFFP